MKNLEKKRASQPPFCQSTIEYIEPEQNVKSGYFCKKEHSVECGEMNDKSKTI